jgi:hypothetical protein
MSNVRQAEQPIMFALVPSPLRSLPARSFTVAQVARERLLVASSNMGLPVAARSSTVRVGCPSFGGQRTVVLLRARSRGDLRARRTGHRCCALPRRRDMKGREVAAESRLMAVSSSALPNPSFKRTSLSWLRQPKAAA